MGSHTVALLTSTHNPKLCGSGSILQCAFEKAGYHVRVLPWDIDADWNEFSALFVLECWNYHLKRGEFLSWVEKRAKEHLAIWNSPDFLRWNTEKSYLLDLEKKGIAILPTVLLNADDPRTIRDVMKEKGWHEAVVKPLVGASAFGAQKVTAESAPAFDTSLDRSVPWIVQKFYPDIAHGEYSFVFFNRTFSHAVLKVPKKNEFRVHIDFGGKELLVTPDLSLVAQAQKIVDSVPGPLLYARVDAVAEGSQLILMELELTEPYLFFDADPAAAYRFVAAYEALEKDRRTNLV